MRLYPKKIHNQQELRQEKRYLNKMIRESGDLDFFVGGSGKSNKKKAAAAEEDDDDTSGLDLSALIGSFAGSKSIWGMLLSTGLPLLIDLIPQKTKSGFFRKVLKEFGLGYLYWKGIQLGFKLVRSFFDKEDKDKKED